MHAVTHPMAELWAAVRLRPTGSQWAAYAAVGAGMRWAPVCDGRLYATAARPDTGGRWFDRACGAALPSLAAVLAGILRTTP